MRPNSLASRLPFDILHHIFLHLQDFQTEQSGEPSHGGRLIGWDSTEALRSLPLVCRAWEEPAVAVLYHSIYLSGSLSATCLRRTLEARSELAELVRKIAIGLRDDDGDQISLHDRLEASQCMVKTLRMLPSIDHVLIRPLDPSVRPQLLPFFAARRRRLKSLVLIARDLSGTPRRGSLFQSEDWPLLLDGLQRLDLDLWGDAAAPSAPISISSPQLCLTHLCLDSDCSSSFTYSLICDSLTHLRLYFETIRDPRTAAQALAKAVSLRHLNYVSNPPIDLPERHSSPSVRPTLDLLLPSLPQLETLHVSSTDISPYFIEVVPPRLRLVVIQSYSSFGFERPEDLLDLLRRPSVNSHGLRELEIRDSTERWEELEQPLINVCTRRGIRFELVMSETLDE